jgi:lipopolysaccharide/colanic/teichoic acid biosynthesis glycosyltransferase
MDGGVYQLFPEQMGGGIMNLELAQMATRARLDLERQVIARLAPRQWLRLRFYTVMLLLDCLIVSVSAIASNLIRFGNPFATEGFGILAVLLPLYVLMGLHRQIYASELLTNWRVSAQRAITSLAMATMAVIMIGYLLHASTALSRVVFTLTVAISGVLLVLSRRFSRHYSNQLLGGRVLSELLIQDGIQVEPTEGVIALDAEMYDLRPDTNDPHMLDRLGRLLKAADRVIIACEPDRRDAWAMVLKGANIVGELLTPEIGALGTLGAGRFGKDTTLIVSTGPLDMHNRALKRLLDLTFSISALIALAPLMVVTAICIRLESPGPIFFVQPRLGRGNRLFNVYKFRSMRADLCDLEGNQSTLRGDSRITRVGRIIRATSIDELPQILNVIKGDMSVVGPRPHALGSLAGDKLFWQVDRRYWHRHAAKPGITGLAQVRGFRGATHLQSDLVDRLQADLDYLSGWTIWRDISILAATLRVLLHRNAY